MRWQPDLVVDTPLMMFRIFSPDRKYKEQLHGYDTLESIYEFVVREDRIDCNHVPYFEFTLHKMC